MNVNILRFESYDSTIQMSGPPVTWLVVLVIHRKSRGLITGLILDSNFYTPGTLRTLDVAL